MACNMRPGTHECQTASHSDRRDERTTRLGGNPGTTAPVPDRPKGMWQRTYERLRDQVADAERVADESYVLQAARLLHASKRRTAASADADRSALRKAQR